MIESNAKWIYIVELSGMLYDFILILYRLQLFSYDDFYENKDCIDCCNDAVERLLK